MCGCGYVVEIVLKFKRASSFTLFSIQLGKIHSLTMRNYRGICNLIETFDSKHYGCRLFSHIGLNWIEIEMRVSSLIIYYLIISI